MMSDVNDLVLGCLARRFRLRGSTGTDAEPIVEMGGCPSLPTVFEGLRKQHQLDDFFFER